MVAPRADDTERRQRDGAGWFFRISCCEVHGFSAAASHLLPRCKEELKAGRKLAQIDFWESQPGDCVTDNRIF